MPNGCEERQSLVIKKKIHIAYLKSLKPYLIFAAIHSYLEKKIGVKYIEKIWDGDVFVLKWFNSMYKREKTFFYCGWLSLQCQTCIS